MAAADDDDELTACRRENEDLRDKLRRLVPEWKSLRMQVQKLTASEAAAVARAEQLAVAANLSPSSASSTSDDAAVFRAKLKQLVPDWKRLKEANESLIKSEASFRLKSERLESELQAAIAELEMLRDAANELQEQKSDLEPAVREQEFTQEAERKMLALEADLTSAHTELERLREIVRESQERESENAATILELEQLREDALKARQFQSELDSAFSEIEELRRANQGSQYLQSKLDAVNAELAQTSSQSRELEEKLDAAYLELEKLPEALYRAQELEGQLQAAYADLAGMREMTQDLLQRAELVERLERQVDQQGAEMARLQKRVEKAMQRPTKLELQKAKHENTQLQKRLSIESKVVRALQADIAEISSSKERIGSLCSELEDLQTRFSICQESRDSLIVDGDKLEAENRMLHSQIDELQNNPTEFNDLREFFKDSMSGGKTLTCTIQDEFALLNNRLTSSLNELTDLKSELCEKSSELEIAYDRQQQLSEQLQSLISSVSEKENELSLANAKIGDLLQQLQPGIGTEPGDPASCIRNDERSDLNLGFSNGDVPSEAENMLESDSNKFHHYQNRIEFLEEEVLELSTRNLHLQQLLSRLTSELHSTQESNLVSSSVLRDEAVLLLQLLSEKDQLVEDLASQLNDLRKLYGEKALTLKATITGLRSHIDGLQQILDLQADGLVRGHLAEGSPERRQFLHDSKPQVHKLSHFMDSASLEPELENVNMNPSAASVGLREAQAVIQDLRRQLEDAQNQIHVDEENLGLRGSETGMDIGGTVEEHDNEQLHDPKEAQIQIDELRRQLQNSQLRVNEQDLDLRNAQVQIDELTAAHAKRQIDDLEELQRRIEELLHDLMHCQQRIDAKDLELKDARGHFEKQDSQLQASRSQLKDLQLELKAVQSRLDQNDRNLVDAQNRFDAQRSELEAAENRIQELLSELESTRARSEEQNNATESAQMRIDELRLQLDDSQLRIDEQVLEIEASRNRIEKQRQLGEAIVRNYNELRGHYDLLVARVESEAPVIEHITRAQSSRSLSPKKFSSSPTAEASAFKPAVAARSASVPVKKRNTLKQFLVKLFERPIYDENGKPVSRVDLTEDTTFVWDPVKKKYIDLNAPQAEERPISKPPPRPAFALAPPAPGSSSAGPAPPPRKPNRSLTGSRYALPDGMSEAAKVPKGPSVGTALKPTPGNPSKPIPAIGSVVSAASSNGLYRPPTINSFEDVVVITSDYHSLVASLLALQKELACVKRSKLETDIYVSTLVRQIKEKLTKAPADPVISDSVEFSKLICCVLIMAGIVSAMTQIPA